MQLTFLSRETDLTRLACQGTIRYDVSATVPDPVEAAAGPDAFRQRLVIDLEGTDFIDSSGVGWMVFCHKAFRQAGGRLVFHSIPPLVYQVLDLLRLPTVLHLAADEDSARRLALEG